MGETLSVLLTQPFSDLVDVTEDETQTTTTPKATDSDVEPTPQKPTTRLLRAPPTPYEPKKRAPFQWRVVDAQSFVYKGVIRVIRVDDLQDLEVIAISYAWSDDIKKWSETLIQMGTGRTYEDKILRGSNRVSQALAGDGFPDMSSADQASISRAHLFFTAVAFLVFTRGKKFFWMDILCINQEELAEKGFFVPQMATLYRNTYETHAYPSGTEIAPSVLHESVQKPIWETRAWTVQEHILAKRVMFCYLFMGDVMDEVRGMIAEHGSSDDEPEVDMQLNSPVLNRFKYTRGVYLLRRGEHAMTSHMEAEGPFGNFAGKVMSKFFPGESNNSGVDEWDMVREATSRSTMHKDIVYIRESGDLLAKARMCLEILPMRKSTWPEDMIYSALGAFEMEDFVPEYDIGFEEARLRVFEGMGAMVLSHLLGVDWGSKQDGAHKDSSLPRIVGGAPTVGATYLKSSILDCKYDRTVGLKLRCRAERWRIWKPVKDILTWTTFTRYTLRNDRLILVQGTGYDQESPVSTPSGASTSASQPEHVRNIVIDGSSIGISDEEYFNPEAQPFEQIVEFVEVGPCHGTPMVYPVANTTLFLVALCTNRLASGNHRNVGAAFIADMDGFTSEFADVVIE